MLKNIMEVLQILDYVTKEGYKLGMWIANQKTAYKNRSIPKEERTNTFKPLTDEQVAKLERLGIVWSIIKTWDEWYELAEKYANTHNGSVAGISHSYTTKEGYKLGSWILNQKTAYRNRSIPKKERTNRFAPLTDEQVLKLERIGMILNVKKNKSQIEYICEVYDINFEKNKKILKVIPASLLQAKIDYCLKNDIPLTINEELNEMFIMSGVNLYVKYGIEEKDLLNEYQLKRK